MADGKVELASRHLDSYLQVAEPNDVAAMAMLAKIQADTADEPDADALRRETLRQVA